ncbi:unnamed protein product [Arctia plantaginis]|uniref:Uncharacterized protein n=1 Tax=Arctia plantaginis TaxID=874455 RepID=A0A8S0YXV2_ARCPL|nr:unnamed protein product [Arctia plantaginis]
MIFIITLLYFAASSCTARPFEENVLRNVITVPPNCPPGQTLVNGICRDVWRAALTAPSNVINEFRNVVTVPPNCPPGQELVNGKCRDVWRAATAAPLLGESAEEVKNVIVAPPNCRPGQVLVNQRCYDLWSILHGSRNIIVAPSNCPPGQQLVNGSCRDVWRSANVMDTFFEQWRNMLSGRERQVENEASQFENKDPFLPNNDFVKDKNVINVPNQCPAGYRPDALGKCRPYLVTAEKVKNVIVAPPNCRPGQVLVNQRCYDLWSILHGSRNIIVAPSNCPPGQQLVNGSCRDVWRSSKIMDTIFANWRTFLSRIENQIQIDDSQFHNKDPLLTNNDFENRHVINVPHQCPIGYRADALGNCRRIWR